MSEVSKRGSPASVSKEEAFKVFKKIKNNKTFNFIQAKHRNIEPSTLRRLFKYYNIVSNGTPEEISECLEAANSKVYVRYALEFCGKDITNQTSCNPIKFISVSIDEYTALKVGYEYLQEVIKDRDIARKYAEEYERAYKEEKAHKEDLENRFEEIKKLLEQ